MGYKKYFVLSLLFLLLVACSSSTDSQLSGRVLLWHSFAEADTVVLHQILDKFREIYPDVQVVSAVVPSDQLFERYQSAAEQGLGPDLLIGPNAWVSQLAENQLLEDISPTIADTTLYIASAIESLRLSRSSTQEDPVPLYGLPLSLRPVALYYNTRLVTTPATTLDEWLAHAAEGKKVALNTSFDEAFWGIQAFGGRLFDEEGRVILNQGGFANWLNWLKKAKDEPGMILNRDDLTLRELFIDRKAAYYVGRPEILPLLQEKMNGDVSVAPLPAGPNGPSGPLLDVEAIMFNLSSSRNQKKLALELAKFLTNIEQNTVLMRETGRVPVNQRIRVDSRVFPAIAGFSAQASTAVAPSNLPQMEFVRESGTNTYTEVLQGATDLTQATLKLTDQVNQEFGFESIEPSSEACQLTGELLVSHYFTGTMQTVLQDIANDFQANCSGATITLIQSQSAENLYNRLPDKNSPERPDLIIGRNNWVSSLAKNEEIFTITAQIEQTTQQAYVPMALEALRFDQALFGLPFSLDFATLYVNTQRSNSPPTTLDELLSPTASDQNILLPITFEGAFWGISAFSEPLFNEESYPVWEAGFRDWLTWLREAQKKKHILLGESEVLSDTNQVDLIVAPASQLLHFQQNIEQVIVARLPTGPADKARPLLHVDGFMFTTRPTDLSLAFALYATEVKSQEWLMTQAQRVPINVKANKEQYPDIETLFGQVQDAILLPHALQPLSLDSYNWVYSDVLDLKLDSTDTVCGFTRRIKQESGLNPSDSSPICAPPSDSN